MKKGVFAFILLLLLSGLSAYFFSCVFQASGFTFENHAFRFSVASFCVFLAFSFILLSCLWFFSSRSISKHIPNYSSSFYQDFLPFSPLLFFLLLPLATVHYLTSEDLLLRLHLFGLAVGAAVLYLHWANFFCRGKEALSPLRKFLQKFSALPLKNKLLLLFLFALLLYNAGSALLISEGISFSGDEPHYLLITHSLLTDGDFNLADNYADRDYVLFMKPHVKIQPHIAPGTQGRYSFHSPGISLALYPFYALGFLFKGPVLAFLIRFGVSIFGALLGLQIFLFALQEWKNEKLALGLWFLFSFTSPVFFYSLHVYPEIIVAFLSLAIFRKVHFSRSFSKHAPLVLGLGTASLMWFHAIKYIFILVPLFLYSLWVLGKKHKNTKALLAFSASAFSLISLYFFFQYKLYGSLSLSAVSWKGAVPAGESFSYLKSLFLDIPFRFRWETLAGYFFDQRDGLLLYAPLYFFVFLGIVEIARRKGKEFFLLLFLTAPYILNSAFLTQRTGYAPQARPLVAVSWVLVLFLGYFLAFNTKKIFSYVFHFSVFLSLSAVWLLLKNPLALYQLTTFGETERAGYLFQVLSNLHFYLPPLLPSYLKLEGAPWLPNTVWLVGLFLFICAYLLLKRHDFSPGFGRHLFIAFLGLGLFFIWIVLYPRTVLIRPQNATFPSGEKVTFHSLSRVARMEEPGSFLLPEDRRFYWFFFSSWREFRDIRIEFGNREAADNVKIEYFDMEIYNGITQKEIKAVNFASVPSYRWKHTNLYFLNIYIERKSGPSIERNPYLFSFSPVS